MPNLSLKLVESVRNFPDRIALRRNDLSYTFTEFDEAAAPVATFLDREGVEPGDRVGLMLPNSPAFALAYYGVKGRGAVAVLMNPLLKAREVEFYLSNTGATGAMRRARGRAIQSSR
jgi:long-chain acyl-CoA synthetase